VSIGEFLVKIGLEGIKNEKDGQIMEAHGRNYEKVFSQDHQCEK